MNFFDTLETSVRKNEASRTALGQRDEHFPNHKQIPSVKEAQRDMLFFDRPSCLSGCLWIYYNVGFMLR